MKVEVDCFGFNEQKVQIFADEIKKRVIKVGF